MGAESIFATVPSEKSRYLVSGSHRATGLYPQRGVVIVCNGEKHQWQTRYLIQSLRKCGYAGSILTIEDPSLQGYASRKYKTALSDISPFGETLFLDSDTVVLKDIGPLWDLLEQNDLWMALDVHPTLETASRTMYSPASPNERLLSSVVCPADTPFFNSGVILFRKTDRVRAFFAAWQREWKRFSAIDQFAAVRAMVATGVFPAELAPCWNYPAKLFLSWPASRDIRIMHCWNIPRAQYGSLVRAVFTHFSLGDRT